jgi:hypothetical protein
VDIPSVLRGAAGEAWLEVELGPPLLTYASQAQRKCLADLLSDVALGQVVSENAALQHGIAALAYANTDEERARAHHEIDRCVPSAYPSASERAALLSAAIRAILQDIRTAGSSSQSEALASAVLHPLGRLIRLLVEEGLAWPTDPLLAQALWDCDREHPVWELISHIRP